MNIRPFVSRIVALAAAITVSACFANTLGDANAAYQAGDFEKAMSIAKPLAIEGNADAQYLTGLMYWRGRAVNRDDGAAAEWFAKAVSQNHKEATNDLGAMYRDGEGVGKDERRAFELFERAAENGSSAGQFNAGKAYQHGLGTRKNNIRARYWYERSDATEARAERLLKPVYEPSVRSGEKSNVLPDGCRPLRPPISAMNKLGLKQASGNISFFVDADGKVRGVTHLSISDPELRYEAVAFFSESLRSKECAIDPAFRDRRMQIPFRFEVTGW